MLKLVDSAAVHLARMLGLVKRIRPAQLKGDATKWVLLVEGLGFTRLLRAEVLPNSPALVRPMGWNTPRPEVFRSMTHALRYIERMGWGPPKRFEVVEPNV
ncbi:hypothetical protein E2F46_06580 [Luteimonas aestuarii]|uniref:Uncharacterized protein n=1 Tax=Luteimonas aestuarii TaxID=453837 RepID=A0A4R5TYG1_9GAMM|nr:hypothetical protein [Luteimonas aestuarii]TDK26256.1 hypothetical protein E2F46_06580 [Luteimonas aestuarii]